MKKIKNFTIQQIIAVASFIYKNVTYKPKDVFVKVNLGCGLQCLPGWVNVDGSLTSLFGSKKFSFINKLLYRLAGSSDYFSFDAYNKVIQKDGLKFYNLKNRVPFCDNSVDVIYCSHFLEHLNKNDGAFFLKECLRSLKKGGLLRIVMPDLDFAMEMYQQGQIEEMQGLFFYTSENLDFAAHKHNYNFPYLKNILENIGFTDIEKMSYRKGNSPGIDYLDVYPGHSLFVESRK